MAVGSKLSTVGRSITGLQLGVYVAELELNMSLFFADVPGFGLQMQGSHSGYHILKEHTATALISLVGRDLGDGLRASPIPLMTFLSGTSQTDEEFLSSCSSKLTSKLVLNLG